TGVVEEADASDSQRAISEVNAGVYAFEASWLWLHLSLVPRSAKGEFYITYLIRLAAQAGLLVQGVAASHSMETLGINHRGHLAQAEAFLRQQVRERLMLSGVTLMDPPSTFIDASVQVGEDTVVYPQTLLLGATRIGRGCHVGPGSLIQDSTIGDNCRVLASVVEGATLEEGVDVGPYSHLRPGSYVEKGVHIGNFAEVKNSRLGQETKVGHFSYLGDATIGPGVNVGAGTVTCNFDGRQHHPTRIGAGAFIGSDTMLVAPVTVGEGAVTGAGSVVTRDVGPGEVAYGVPARARPSRARPERAKA
ncbi:MAG: bifunctional N-acetylglucosamine-1-phosphate uridyltransferase/glucosamine-1-phosphate acetyltransferase, partial [Chloroflexi bacterium]|nr:bifunctional N-acetylglucosamine-1-phosphate uridyltransferase/glucosamine-1-phosphate acetyltransferase [Chloroflexota bacterium]